MPMDTPLLRRTEHCWAAPRGAQDRTFMRCCSRHLLELAYQFIVYDGGVKKIARYQQYFAIEATLERVIHYSMASATAV